MNVMGHLRGGIENENILLPVADGSMGLHGGLLGEIAGEISFLDVIRVPETFIDVPKVMIDLGVDIIGIPLVQQGRTILHGLEGVEYRGYFLVIDIDQFQSALGGFLVHGSHCGHLVAHVPHNILCEHELVISGRAHTVLYVGDVLSRDDSFHTGQRLRLRCIDSLYSAMSYGAVQDLAVKHSSEGNISGIFRPPGGLVPGVIPGQTLANYLERIHIVFLWFRLRHGGISFPVLYGVQYLRVTGASA